MFNPGSCETTACVEIFRKGREGVDASVGADSSGALCVSQYVFYAMARANLASHLVLIVWRSFHSFKLIPNLVTAYTKPCRRD